MRAGSDWILAHLAWTHSGPAIAGIAASGLPTRMAVHSAVSERSALSAMRS
jgi:hypothetical protein